MKKLQNNSIEMQQPQLGKNKKKKYQIITNEIKTEQKKKKALLKTRMKNL